MRKHLQNTHGSGCSDHRSIYPRTIPWVLDAVVRTVCGPGPPYNVGEGFTSGGAGPWSPAGGGCFFNRPAVFPF